MKKTAEKGPFARVWEIVGAVPRGKVVTYGQLSEMIGGRLTPVGIGWALRAAPEELLPWHRVVNSRGTVSTDGENPGLQRAMLEAEGVTFGYGGAIDLEKYAWRPKTKTPPKKRAGKVSAKTKKRSKR